MHVEGFGPIKKETFDWGIQGLNIIQAPNGYGKTKFINALFWGLYGKTLSGSVETWDFIRGQDYLGTKVEINFLVGTKEVKVIRCKEYRGIVEGAKGKNRLVVLVDGEETLAKDKRDTQGELEMLLGYSEELFKNSIIFGQKLKRLISETGPNKKKVFDEAFEVLYISKARELAEVEYKSRLEEYEDQSRVVNGIIKDCDTMQGKLDREKEIVENFDTNKNNSIREQEYYIKANNERIGILTPDQAAIDLNTTEQVVEVKDKLKKLGKEHDIVTKSARLELQLEQGEKEAKRLKESLKKIPSICPNCNKPYTASEKKAEEARILNQYQEITQSNELLRGNLTEAKKVYSSLLKLKKELELLESSLKKLEEINAEISRLDKDTESRKKTIENLKAQTVKNNCEEYTRILSALKDGLKIEKAKLRVLHKKVSIGRWLINDPLSNKGLKAYIFETMLDSLNDKLAEYSRFIGFQVLFDIDLNSHNKDLLTFIYNGSNAVPYDDLSGGQKQAVDVVSAFAIHDVVNDGRECNLLVLDEVFESLDKNNIEIVTELIQDKAKDKALYLITHLDGFNPTSANIIKIQFENGIASLG